MFCRKVVYPLIDLLCGDSRLDVLRHIVKDCYIQFSALTDPLDLCRCLDDLVGRNLVACKAGTTDLLVKCHMALTIWLPASTPAWIIFSDSAKHNFSSFLSVFAFLYCTGFSLKKNMPGIFSRLTRSHVTIYIFARLHIRKFLSVYRNCVCEFFYFPV